MAIRDKYRMMDLIYGQFLNSENVTYLISIFVLFDFDTDLYFNVAVIEIVCAHMLQDLNCNDE
jgi:hypothetical protein